MNDPIETPAPPTFADIGLSAPVLRAIEEMGFAEPTPVQTATYPPAVEGHDLIVQARTGTGKTAAFGLPLVDRLVGATGGPQVLILAPTRELALQSSREIARLGVHKGIRTAAVYGGAPIERQVRELEAGAQIVSGTPGRVLDHLKRGTLDGGALRILVLDEADEMLSMGFAKELNAIVALLPAKRQTMLFSATIDDAVERMASRILKDPQRVSLSSDAVGAQTITHFYYLVTNTGKTQSLIQILENDDPESALIFCNTRVVTERTAQELKAAGFNADWLNGDLPQSEREKVLARTREGSLRYLVATDVAARGIDISHVTHVINYDFPENIESYIHRTGRTGRAGRTGTAIALVAPSELGSLYYLRLQYKIFPIERSLPSSGELLTRLETDRIALLSEAFPKTPDELDLAVARRLLTHPDAERILGGLLRAFLGPKEDVDEEAAAARRERPARPAPAPAPAPRARRERTERMGSAPREDAIERDDAPAEAPASFRGEARDSGRDEARDEARDEDEAPEDDENSVFLYVNLGRRDNIRPGQIVRLFVEQGEVDKSDVGRIRIRDRHSFVGVPREKADDIVDRLHGAAALDKDLVVEIARAQP